MVGGTTESDCKQHCEFSVMSTTATAEARAKATPFLRRLEAQLKSKSASLPTPLDGGGAGNAVKGQDERRCAAPWTAFPAHMPPSVLTTAIVVIHGDDCARIKIRGTLAA